MVQLNYVEWICVINGSILAYTLYYGSTRIQVDTIHIDFMRDDVPVPHQRYVARISGLPYIHGKIWTP